MKDVFPIAYDVSKLVVGRPRAVRGTILRTPRKRLRQSAVYDLIIKMTKLP